MDNCCEEAGCHRKQPMHIFIGDFSKQVFIATRSREVKKHEDGTATLCAIQKHDITYQMIAFISRNPEWVREQLARLAP